MGVGMAEMETVVTQDRLTQERPPMPRPGPGLRPRRQSEGGGLDDPVMEVQKLSISYGAFRAVREVDLNIARHRITAIIGPSGCGKTTMLRALNRMNELVPTAHTEGRVLFDGADIYAPQVDSVEVRRRVGMVFQKPNPFPKSIHENIAWGARINGFQGDMDEHVERCLRRAALWDEVHDKLKQSGLSLSGGQQQRLCIARALAVEPEVILMDEPCSALDPIATLKIEELMHELSRDYSIVIVTHNMQQAARVSDYTAMMMMDESRAGSVIEFDETEKLFTRPKNPRTEDYPGRFARLRHDRRLPPPPCIPPAAPNPACTAQGRSVSPRGIPKGRRTRRACGPNGVRPEWRN
jgi:phosphate transport system ATP-binding protein